MTRLLYYKKLPVQRLFSDLLASDKSVSLRLQRSCAGHGSPDRRLAFQFGAVKLGSHRAV